jgi:hypothetical protein
MRRTWYKLQVRFQRANDALRARVIERPGDPGGRYAHDSRSPLEQTKGRSEPRGLVETPPDLDLGYDRRRLVLLGAA